MKNILLIMLVIFIVGVEFKSTPAQPTQNCVDRDQLEKLISDHKLQTLLQSFTETGKTHEIMMTPLNKGELFIVEYDKTENNKKYCVLSITNNTNINDDAVDNLYNALERVRGHRA